MGQVLLVEHIHTGERFALKVLLGHGGTTASAVERFKREARAPALIRSEHVVRVTDADIAYELGSVPFLVMELLDGSDFEQILAERGWLPPAEVVDVLAQVAKALDKAHAIGIVHRDLKPANLFLHHRESGPVVKILDFGISKLLRQDDSLQMDMQGLTMVGMVIGTPAFMAPEQARGQAQDIGPATDIWAVGMVAFQLLTGDHYWPTSTFPELLMNILAGEMPPPSARAPELPPAFDAWFARSCSRNGFGRFPSAGAQVAALAQAFGVTQRSPEPENAHSLIHVGARHAGQMAATTVRAPGGDLPSPAHAPPQKANPHAERTAREERRQVTVMYCAVGAGSADASDVDPEDIAGVIGEAEAACEEALRASGQFVMRPMRDGRLLYFGLPVASGDDAARAVAAALRIVESIRRLGERAPAQGIHRAWVRIGIHTGIVVVKEGTDTDEPLTIVGQAGNTAFLVQQSADDNAVTVSGDTYRLIRRRFSCERLTGAVPAGKSQRVEVFRVRTALESPSMELRSVAAPLIGREAELGLLVDRFEQVKEGTGHVALIVGESGVGKSRLLSAFRDLPVEEDKRRRWLEAQCTPDFQSTPFHPMTLVLQRIAGIDRDDPSEQQLAKLERTLGLYSPSSEALPLLSDLLVHGAGAAAARLNLSPQRQREGTIHSFLSLLQEISAADPLCLVIEDVQWMDPSTHELVGLIVDNALTMGVFTILTCQPSFVPPWPLRSHLTQITLSKLPRKRVEAMIRQITGGKPLPPDVIEQIITRTDGVPLFIEELTRIVLESTLMDDTAPQYQLNEPLRALSIPTTLRDSLTARLDRMGPAKRTAQLSAAFGREFTFDHLRAASPLDEDTLKEDLKALVSQQLFQQAGRLPKARFSFKQALVQEAAYESLTKNTRRHHHGLIADMFEKSFPAVGEANPEVLAHHYAAAGVPAQAAGYFLRAGMKSIQRSANLEAISQLGEALAAVESMPDSPERAHLELTVRTTLGVPLIATKGFSAPEVEESYARALELGKHVAESRELFLVVWGLWLFCLVRAKYPMARELADQLLRLADGSPDDGMRMCAHIAQGNTRLMLGDLEVARRHFEESAAIYDPAAHASLAYVYGQDLGMHSRTLLAVALWLLGYPDHAAKMGEEAMACARGSSHPHSVAFALGFDAHLQVYRRDPAAARGRATELARFTAEQKFPFWFHHAQFAGGWVTLCSGNHVEGLAAMMEGRAAFDPFGQRVGNSHFDVDIVEGCITAGEPERGLTILGQVKQFMAETGEASFAPELHRLEGELTLVLAGDRAKAEAHFLRAIEVATKASSRSLGLRAASSLARLRRAQGEREAARSVLGPIYDSFTEGFDVEDLRVAKALLDD